MTNTLENLAGFMRKSLKSLDADVRYRAEYWFRCNPEYRPMTETEIQSKGGRSTSELKVRASRINGRKGGRPRKSQA